MVSRGLLLLLLIAIVFGSGLALFGPTIRIASATVFTGSAGQCGAPLQSYSASVFSGAHIGNNDNVSGTVYGDQQTTSICADLLAQTSSDNNWTYTNIYTRATAADSCDNFNWSTYASRGEYNYSTSVGSSNYVHGNYGSCGFIHYYRDDLHGQYYYNFTYYTMNGTYFH